MTTTAIARGNGYLTVGDILLLELPHLPEETRVDVAWEFTGYPCFWAGDGHIINLFRAQLVDFREGRSVGL